MEHPFPYVGSGIAAARKHMELWVCFRDAIPKSARKEIQSGVPGTVGGYFDWSDRVLVFGHDDDSLQWVVRAAYDHVVDDADDHDTDDEMPSAAMWKAFNADIDTWLLGVNAKHPVAVFVKPIDEEYSTSTDAWHDWSCERIPTDVLPVVATLGKKHASVASYLAQMWRSWVEDQPFDRQQELVAALTDAARAELRKRKALFTPKPKPPEPKRPTLEQSERLWRQCAADLQPMPRGMRLEDAFTAKMIERGFDPDHSLTNHQNALAEAKLHAEVATLCRAALASGVEFPTHWYPPLVNALVAQDSLAEAAVELAYVVGRLESYHPDMLATAMRYHRAANEPEVEAMLYHAGKRWFTSWNYEFTKDEAKRFGAALGRFGHELPKRFATWFIQWCGPLYFDLSRQSELGHFLVWFDKIGKTAFGDWVGKFEAERDRRVKLRDALDATTDAASAEALVDELLPSADTEDASRAFHKIRTHAPLAAYRYLIGTMRNEHRNYYRYPRGERVDAIVSALYLTLNVPELAANIEATYEIGRGYLLVNNAALHFNLACCAARLDRRGDALGHIARSLALEFPNPQQIHDDNDLEPLRGDPAFEQIFIADAARRAAPKVEVADEGDDDDVDADDSDNYDAYDFEDVDDDDVIEEKSAKTKSAKTKSAKAKSAKAKGAKTKGAKTKGAKTKGAKTKGAKTKGAKAERAKAMPAKAKAAKVKPTKAKVAKVKPTKAKVAKVKPTKAKPAKRRSP